MPSLTDLSKHSSDAAHAPTFVRLIDRDWAEQFPHLRPHQGQIVLGQSQLQLIAANVPPLTVSSRFQSLLSAIYKNSGSMWQKQIWLPELEISIAGKNGESLQLVGQDIEKLHGQNRLIATFRHPRSPEGQVRLELELLGDPPLLKASIVNQGIPGPLRWQLRLSAEQGEGQLIPYDQDNVVGMTLSVLPDVLSILSTTPLSVSSEYHSTLLTSTRNNSSAKSSFFLLFDRNSALLQPAMVSQLQQCMRDALKKAKLETDCFKANARNSESWQVQMPNRPTPLRSDKKLFQTLYVHDAKGGFIGTMPIFEGEQLKVMLPVTPGWEMLYPDEQGILKKLSFDADTHSAQLPTLALGSVQIDLHPGRPSFMEIRDAIRPESVSWAEILSPNARDVLSTHSFLQRNWPLQADLPAGDYQLRIFDGMEIICQQHFTILAGGKQTIACQSENPWPNLLSMRANLSLDASASSQDLLSAAHIQAIAHTSRTMDDDDSTVTEIPMLAVEDPNLGLSLRAFPVDDALRKSWQQLRNKERDGLLTTFASFARAQHPPLQLVLQCPSGNFAMEDYTWLALAIQPDIVEVFGCRRADLTDDLLEVAQKLQQKSSRAIKLAAASPFPSRFPWHGLIPAIYVAGQAAVAPGNRSAALVSALRKGDYSLGLRSEIIIPGALPELGRTDLQTVMVRIRSYDLKDQSALLRCYDQDEKLTELPIPPSRDIEQTFNLTFRLRPESRFLRFELLRQGQTAEVGPGGLAQTFLLATSNFLSLNGPP